MYFSISANTSFELSAIEDIDIGSASCKDNNLIWYSIHAQRLFFTL